MKEIFLVILAGLLNLDNVSAFQFLVSRPSFAGAVIGYLSGYPVQGFLIGMLLELVILDFTPVGGVTIPNGTVAVIVSVLLLPKTNPYLAFFLGLIAGEGYSYVEKYLRGFRNRFNSICENMIERYDFNLWKVITLSMILDVIVFSIYSIISIYILSFVAIKLNTDYVFKVSKIALIGTVFITLTSLYFKFKTQVGKND
ncbi:MAG TPA: PTS sugar transporter subunit IIC [Elusimicrobiales bacterium]|nr:PTS sugar transporter subunit IIC [Elusimicrobiales bacterium]HPO94658.1 PTS sugar transporter subunit IIC [Elusimicrobiales bacterium]